MSHYWSWAQRSRLTRGHIRKLRIGAAVGTLLILFGVMVPLASAHALLLRSVPQANAALDRSPAQVQIWFTEAVDPSFSKIMVLNSAGVAVDNRDTIVDAADPTHLLVTIPSLPDGVYTVVWKVLSSTDSHVTTGSFPFALGQFDASALAAAGQANPGVTVQFGEVASRWLTYLGSLMLAGGCLFVLAVWQPAYRATVHSSQTPRDPEGIKPAELWSRLAAGAAVALLAGNVVGLLTKAGEALGTELSSPWTRATADLLFNTRYGILWLAHLSLTLALLTLLLNVRTKRKRWAAFGVALLLLLTTSLGSHAAGESNAWLPVLADWVHLICAAVWVGGLTHFAASLWLARRLPPPVRTGLASQLIPRFSVLALSSVGLLSLTGLYTAILRVGSFENLTGSIYGRVLIVKLLVIAPMLLLGAVNLLIVTPRMRRAAAQPGSSLTLVGRFRRIVTGEVTLATLLLLSVSVLTSVPPAVVASGASGLNFAGQADDLKVELNVVPGRVGVNTFTVTLHSNGQPVSDAQEVALRFTPGGASLPPSEGLLSGQGQGQYQLQGSFLSLPDNWQVQVVVRRTGKFDAFANFDAQLAAGSAPASTFVWHWLGALLVLVTAFTLMFATRGISRAFGLAKVFRYGLTAALALTVGSVYVFFYPDAVTGLPVNPVPPNAASVAAGQVLYQANCVPCHGVRGKGDGPVGLTLNPRPADLTVHTAPGVHPDGQLYDWITNGFSSSAAMPAFQQVLSDRDRWNLVNFIRTLNKPPCC